jgi:hypothetical protein
MEFMSNALEKLEAKLNAIEQTVTNVKRVLER